MEEPTSALSELQHLRTELDLERGLPQLAASRAMRRLNEILERVATTPRTTVFVYGERGVMKEAYARRLHQASNQRSGPFVLLASRSLDVADFDAHVALASGGTLFLRGVERLCSQSQAALLDLLETRSSGRESVRPSSDMRLIAASHADLEVAVRAGTFREDLFYRLNVLSFGVPALRECPEDIVPLATRLLGRGRSLAPSAREALLRHDWPGNVRELKALLQLAASRAVCGPISAEDLGFSSPTARPEQDEPVPLTLEDLSLRKTEEALIRRVLVETGGNRSRAARVLGVNRTTLYNKLKAYEIRG